MLLKSQKQVFGFTFSTLDPILLDTFLRKWTNISCQQIQKLLFILPILKVLTDCYLVHTTNCLYNVGGQCISIPPLNSCVGQCTDKFICLYDENFSISLYFRYVLVSADFNGCIKVFLKKEKPKHSSLPASALV